MSKYSPSINITIEGKKKRFCLKNIFNIKSQWCFGFKGVNPLIFLFSGILRICLINKCDRCVNGKPWVTWYIKVVIQVSLHTEFSSFKRSCVILIIVPSVSKFIYRLTYILLKAFITRNQINQSPFIAVRTMICLKVYLVITTSKWIRLYDVIANLALFSLTLVWVCRSL